MPDVANAVAHCYCAYFCWLLYGLVFGTVVEVNGCYHQYYCAWLVYFFVYVGCDAVGEFIILGHDSYFHKRLAFMCI